MSSTEPIREPSRESSVYGVAPHQGAEGSAYDVSGLATAPGVPLRGLAHDAAYDTWMGRALELAADAGRAGDVPIGAVVADPDGRVVGEGRNVRERDGDPTGHAEVVALRAAARAVGTWRLEGCTLVVTLEPCPMCAGAASLARVGRIVLGAWDPKAGACGSVWDVVRDRHVLHRVEVVGGVRERDCADVLLRFFDSRR